MKHTITYIILPVLVGIACSTSCTSESDGLDSRAKEVVKFDAIENLSRACVTNGSNLIGHDFLVFGDQKEDGELKMLFDGNTVKFNESDNAWDYREAKPLEYWAMGQEHSFIALHPYPAEGMENIKYESSAVSFDYAIPSVDGIVDYGRASDILVATHRRCYNLDATGPVLFRFNHVLSRIVIAPTLDERLMYEDNPSVDDRYNNEENNGDIKDEYKGKYVDEFIQFRKIEIKGLLAKGSFTLTPAALQGNNFSTDDCNIVYNADNSSVADAVLNFTDPVKVTNNKDKSTNICPDEEALIVMPQSFGDNQVTIILYYTINTDTPLRKITLTLPAGIWESGKSYTYKFTVEKAYTGQIADGSLEVEIDDFRLVEENVDDSWINGGDDINYGLEGDGSWGPHNYTGK